MTSISDWGDLMERTYYLNGENQRRMKNRADEPGGKGVSANVPITNTGKMVKVTLYFTVSLLLFVCTLNSFPSDHIFEVVKHIHKLLK